MIEFAMTHRSMSALLIVFAVMAFPAQADDKCDLLDDPDEMLDCWIAETDDDIATQDATIAQLEAEIETELAKHVVLNERVKVLRAEVVELKRREAELDQELAIQELTLVKLREIKQILGIE